MMTTLSHLQIKTKSAILAFAFVPTLLLSQAAVDSVRAQGPQSNAQDQAQPKPQADQSGRPPVTKKELLTVLQNAGIPPARLLDLVKQRGVDFQSSLTDEAELGKAGASAELLEAIGANYRAYKKKSGLAKFNDALNKINSALDNSTQSTPTTSAASTTGPASTDGQTAPQTQDKQTAPDANVANNAVQPTNTATTPTTDSPGPTKETAPAKQSEPGFPKPDFTEIEKYFEVAKFAYDTPRSQVVMIVKPKTESRPSTWEVTFRDADGVAVGPTFSFYFRDDTKVGEAYRASTYTPSESEMEKVKTVELKRRKN